MRIILYTCIIISALLLLQVLVYYQSLVGLIVFLGLYLLFACLYCLYCRWLNIEFSRAKKEAQIIYDLCAWGKEENRSGDREKAWRILKVIRRRVERL